MKPSSSPSDLLGPLFGVAEVDAEVSDAALLRAMLDVESALAFAGADAGVVPPEAAREIAAACSPERFDLARLGAEAVASGNPVVPLVREMGPLPWLHHGATSQDVLDTAMVLVVVRAVSRFALDAAASECARLVREHRRTVMAARTLGQQAGPTTFGLKAAGWLSGLDRARMRLFETVAGLPVQLGGPVGTLAAYGAGGTVVLERLAARLELAVPAMPWHTNRQPVLEVATALGAVAAAAGKIAVDVGLLAQTEVGEVSEGSPGGSSALPHKRNPVDSVLVIAAARRVPGLVATLFSGLHEHERAAGSWHAEWEPLRELVRLTGSAAARVRRLLAGLEIHADRMRANLDARVMAESVTHRLAASLGRSAAHDLVARLSAEPSFRDALIADPDVGLSPDEIDAALDPSSWLGSADALVDRALAAHDRTTAAVGGWSGA